MSEYENVRVGKLVLKGEKQKCDIHFFYVVVSKLLINFVEETYKKVTIKSVEFIKVTKYFDPIYSFILGKRNENIKARKLKWNALK